jgi:hypothetical protein
MTFQNSPLNLQNERLASFEMSFMNVPVLTRLTGKQA